MNNSDMGGACSMHRNETSLSSSSCRRGRRHSRYHRSSNRRKNGDDDSDSMTGSTITTSRRYSRHSVVSQFPDKSIDKLYAAGDNYITNDDGTRSPRSLAELCIDMICRSLPNMNGSLPSGLPQEIVDDIVRSLTIHSAMNATTLRALQHCEVSSLCLVSSRGVRDYWFDAFHDHHHHHHHQSLEDTEATEMTETSTAAATAALSTNNVEQPYFETLMDDPMDIDDDHDDHNAATALLEGKAEIPQQNKFRYDGANGSPSSSSGPFKGSAMSKTQGVEHQQGDHGPRNSLSIDLHDSISGSSESDDYCSTFSKLHEDEDGDGQELEEMLMMMAPTTTTDGFSLIYLSGLTLLDLRGSQRLTDKGLLQLGSDLSSLQVAQLDGCFSIVGRGLLIFSNSFCLHTLTVSNCRRLTDEALINVSHLLTLETLSLANCRCITDRTLSAIAGLNRLKKLDMSMCDLITDSGIQKIATLPLLEELSFGWCGLITDSGIETLVHQRGRKLNLRSLCLARIQSMTDEGVDHLSHLDSLQHLDLNGCSGIGSVALGSTLQRLTHLESLDVSYCPGILRSSWRGNIPNLKVLDVCYSGVRDSHISRLNSKSLSELNLEACPVGDWSLAHLVDATPNLTSLNLADTDVSDLGMVHIGKMTKLKQLSLFYCNLSNSSLRHLSQLEDLESLNLDSRDIGDSGVWHLRGLKKLKSLDLFSGRITDTGCSHIAKIKSLESLELCGGSISDIGCSILATLENLTSLNLAHNERITNRGAAALAALSNLRAINLGNTRVDSGALIHFSDLTNLKSLSLYGCQEMDESDVLDKFQDGLPNLKCIRLNNGQDSDDDGMIGDNASDDVSNDVDSIVDEGDSELNDDEDMDAQFSDAEMGDATASDQNGDDGNQGAIGDDGNDEDDDENSDTSWSDHDYHH